MQYRILLVVVMICGLAGPGHAEQGKNYWRDFLVEELHNAIRLNEDLKSNWSGTKSIAVEVSYKNTLFNVISDIIVYSQINDDTELVIEFLKMIVSYQNFADEEFSCIAGEMFLVCPDLVLEAILSFNKEEKQWICGDIEFGVRCVLYDKEVPSEKQRLIDEHMDKLRLLVEIETPIK